MIMWNRLRYTIWAARFTWEQPAMIHVSAGFVATGVQVEGV